MRRLVCLANPPKTPFCFLPTSPIWASHINKDRAPRHAMPLYRPNVPTELPGKALPDHLTSGIRNQQRLVPELPRSHALSYIALLSGIAETPFSQSSQDTGKFARGFRGSETADPIIEERNQECCFAVSMLSTSRSRDTSSSLLSPHPSLLLLDCGSDHTLAWDTKSAKAEISARAPAYPSPPMSGSPSLPPKDPRNFYDRSEGFGAYSTTTSSQDVYRTNSGQQRPVDLRLQLPPPRRPPPQYHPRISVQYRPESNMEPPYGYQGSDGRAAQAALYSSREPPDLNKGQHLHQYGSMVVGTSSTSQQSVESGPNSTENQSMGSPKSQRKTKGHVASACVPCKRAHLR
ncbi:C6 zinc finger domain-containing protein [Metarhizium brunneum]